MKTYTREAIEEIFEQRVQAAAKQWGEQDYWTKSAMDDKDRALKAYDEGKVIVVEKEPYHENGMDWEKVYYSDGSVKNVCYGYTY